MSKAKSNPGAVTRNEILQQPELWQITFDQLSARTLIPLDDDGLTCVSGAGTSAYAASAIAKSWPHTTAVPTTDLLLDDLQMFSGRLSRLLSIARSGDSPESLAAVKHVQKILPEVRHLAITCNANGALARAEGVEAIVLDPRTNDQGLVMTSSFSNLTLAGMVLRNRNLLESHVSAICRRTESNLTALDQKAEELAKVRPGRIVVLGTGPLFALAQEAALKLLEMTAGQCAAMVETFLGLRHGPMSFLRPDTLVIAFLSADPIRRLYEEDLLQELHRKRIGRIVTVAPPLPDRPSEFEFVEANSPQLPDRLRAPFEIVFPQLLGFHLSLEFGLNPDAPSPDAVITRVVQGVRLHN